VSAGPSRLHSLSSFNQRRPPKTAWRRFCKEKSPISGYQQSKAWPPPRWSALGKATEPAQHRFYSPSGGVELFYRLATFIPVPGIDGLPAPIYGKARGSRDPAAGFHVHTAAALGRMGYLRLGNQCPISPHRSSSVDESRWIRAEQLRKRASKGRKKSTNTHASHRPQLATLQALWPCGMLEAVISPPTGQCISHCVHDYAGRADHVS